MKISVCEKPVAEIIHGSNLIEKSKEEKPVGLGYPISIAQRKRNTEDELIRFKCIIYYL